VSSESGPSKTSPPPSGSQEEPYGARLARHPLWRRTDKDRFERDDGAVLIVNLCRTRHHTQWDCRLLLPGHTTWSEFEATGVPATLQYIDQEHPCEEAPVSSESGPPKTSPPPSRSQGDPSPIWTPTISSSTALAVLAGIGIAELWRTSGPDDKRLMIRVGHTLITGSAPSPEQNTRIAELLGVESGDS